MKLSIPLSIHNRSELFRRALDSYLWQTLPPTEWEIILVDDGSTEDLRRSYDHLLGRINLRHVYFDHTAHPSFKKRNPGWTSGRAQDWFHTPALTTNAGCFLARAPVVGLFHPEVLHAPDNFERAVRTLECRDAFLFGRVWLGDEDVNRWLSGHPDWTASGWREFLEAIEASRLPGFGAGDLYWYCSFLPRRYVEKVGGVAFEFLHGIGYEDCDFQKRIALAGCPAAWDGGLQGLHQDHSLETEPHRRRSAPGRPEAIRRNEHLFRSRDYRRRDWGPANTAFDWTARECIVRIVEYQVGGAISCGAMP